MRVKDKLVSRLLAGSILEISFALLYCSTQLCEMGDAMDAGNDAGDDAGLTEFTEAFAMRSLECIKGSLVCQESVIRMFLSHRSVFFYILFSGLSQQI